MDSKPSPRLGAGTHARGLVLALVMLLPLMFSGLPAIAQDDGEGPADQPTNEQTGSERLVDMTFPLSGPNSFSDTFYAGRSGGRTHRATDLMAEKLVHVHAAVGGEIVTIRAAGDQYTGLSGGMIVIAGDDGLEYSYIHLNNDNPGTDDGQGGDKWAFAPGMEKGLQVERGQWIGYVGDSGNAEHVSHLHFSIHDENQAEESGYINPFRSLVAAQDRGDVPPAPADPNGVDGDGNVTGEPTRAEQPEESDDAGIDQAIDVTRLAGANRISTAVALSREAWSGDARAVVIVPAGSHAEALVAAPLAGRINSPILLSGADGLSAEVTAEIERLDPDSAYIIGTEEQLGPQVAADLAAAGVSFQARLSAADRYELSTVVAREIATYDRDDSAQPLVISSVILALGDAEVASRAWPDALSASALAARTATPVLLVQSDRLPDPVADLLTQFRPGAITVVGGTAAIRGSVAAEAAELADGTITRLSGSTRYATSAAVADASRSAGLDSATVWVATGLNFPDALAAGPAAARAGSPLMLVDGMDPDGSPQAVDWLADNATGVVVVGGTAVVTDEVASAMYQSTAAAS